MNEQCPVSVSVERFVTNPLVTAGGSSTLGTNINGPSVICTPDWLPNPLGRYYMYFAHHTGTYIRLAYADELHGPWKIYEPGTLQLTDARSFRNHIASPDVHVDDENRVVRMYFHGPTILRSGQWTGVAISTDGINFTAKPQLLGKFYFRVWQWDDHWYAIAKNFNKGWGEICRSTAPDGKFELRGNFIKRMRHAAVLVKRNTLFQ